MRTKSGLRGFTLIELLIVVAIIGILAAIAIPNLMTAIQKARQKRTMQDMKTMAIAWESRAADLGRYNAAAAGVPGIDKQVDINDLAHELSPTYIKSMPKEDGWSNPFFCFTSEDFSAGPPATDYALMSAGRDKTLSSTAMIGGTTNFDCDIIFVNGSFIAYPDGTQVQ